MLTLEKNCPIKIKQLYYLILSLINFVKVKNVEQYSRDGLKFDIVLSSFRTKDAKMKQEKKRTGKANKKDYANGDSLFTTSKYEKMDNWFKNKGKSQSKGR